MQAYDFIVVGAGSSGATMVSAVGKKASPSTIARAV